MHHGDLAGELGEQPNRPMHDIVEVDRKGRRFHAVVTGIEQRDSGRFELDVRPLDSRISYRRATVREVVTVYRRAR